MSSSDEGFGKMIEETINQGREDKSSTFKKVDLNDSKYENCDHYSYVMIYSKTSGMGVLNFPLKAIILMQLKYDGYIGFPGGIVDEDETPLEAACRYLKEEIAWCGVENLVKGSDYLFSHSDETNESIIHFFATEVKESIINNIEKKMMVSPNYGTEFLGILRVPLYIMGDAFRGLPSFLRNHFYGISKLQLIEAIKLFGFLTEEQIIQVLYSAPNITK